MFKVASGKSKISVYKNDIVITIRSASNNILFLKENTYTHTLCIYVSIYFSLCVEVGESMITWVQVSM